MIRSGSREEIQIGSRPDRVPTQASAGSTDRDRLKDREKSERPSPALRRQERAIRVVRILRHSVPTVPSETRHIKKKRKR